MRKIYDHEEIVPRYVSEPRLRWEEVTLPE
jgi:hypothetical protein